MMRVLLLVAAVLTIGQAERPDLSLELQSTETSIKQFSELPRDPDVSQGTQDSLTQQLNTIHAYTKSVYDLRGEFEQISENLAEMAASWLEIYGRRTMSIVEEGKLTAVNARQASHSILRVRLDQMVVKLYLAAIQHDDREEALRMITMGQKVGEISQTLASSLNTHDKEKIKASWDAAEALLRELEPQYGQ